MSLKSHCCILAGTALAWFVASSFTGPATLETDGFAYITHTFPSTTASGSAPFPDLPNGAEITQLCTVL